MSALLLSIVALTPMWGPLAETADGTETTVESLAPAASEGERAPPQTVFVMDIEGATLTDDDRNAVGNLIAQQMGRSGAFQVVTMIDVANVLDLEEQKTAMGCDQASCMAELASAMGASAVVYGTAAQTGEQYVFNLIFFDAEQAKVEGRSTQTVASRGAIVRVVPRITYDLTSNMERARGYDPGTRPEFVDDPPPAGFGVMSIAGVGAAAFGGLLALGGSLLATVPYVLLNNQVANAPTAKDANDIRTQWFDDTPVVSATVYGGAALAVVGIVAVVAGVAAIVVDGVSE